MNNLIAGPGRSHQEWGNDRAFAAIRSNGRVVTWGDAGYGGDSSAVANQLTRVTQIFSTGGAFAALKQDGSVVTWGQFNSGGNSSAVANQLTNVTQIFSTRYAFAALKQDGSVVTWGPLDKGGNSSDVAGQLTNVTQIFSTEEGFAALKGDRTVVTWGNSDYGGNPRLANPLTDVTQIFSTRYAFAALKQNGSVVTWGNAQYGGDSIDANVTGQLTSGVTQIFATDGAFAALKQDRTVVTWGDDQYGRVTSPVPGQLTDIRQIFATERAFAALKGNSSVVTWGNSDYGGNSSNVASQLTNVTRIFFTGSAFAALRGDGSVVTWGDTRYGGDSSAAASQITSGVTQIFATDGAFAALKGDGSVVTWGDTQYGGNSSAVASQLTNVSQIFATDRAFAAVRNNGSVVTWGSGLYGGDSSAVASQLRSAVEEIATPFSDDDVPTPFKPIIIDIGGGDSTVSGVTGDNRVEGIAVDPGIGNVIIRSGSTELGTAPVDENGNFTYSLTEDNINTIGQGTGKTITATQSNLGNNISGASAPFTFGVDTIAPTVAITDNVPNFANIATDSILYTLTFSEPVTGFTTGDITVTNGSKGTFTPVSPTQYTLVVTPKADFEGDLTVDVAAGAAIDAAGNPSIPRVSVQRVDTIAPTVTITDNVPNVANIATGSITYTFTFTEAVTDFSAGDITVTNGSKGTFTSVSSTEYTLVVTPDANFEGDLTVAVPAGAAIDVASNPSFAPQASVQRVDTKAPTVTITSIGGGDNRVSGVAGDNTVVGTAEPGSGNVTIRFGNTELGTTAVNENGNFTYSLTTTNLTTIGQGTGKTITASQTDPAGNIGTSNPFTFGVDTIAPTVTITSIGGGDNRVSGVAGDNTVVGTAEPGSGNVTIRFGNTELGTTAVNENGNFTYSLTTTNLTTIGQGTGKTITASQTDPAGNIGTSNPFTFGVDTIAPTVTITSIGGGDNRVSSVAGDNTVVGTAEPGSGNVTIRFGNTELGTTAVNENGNFTYSLTTANLSTIGQGTGKTITASQTDPAGNIGTSSPFTFGVDTIAPTVDISKVENTNGTFLYKFTFSEPVTGFTAEDITVTNGIKGTFTPVSDTTYELLVTRNGNLAGQLSIAQGAAFDSFNNPSMAATAEGVPVDPNLVPIRITSQAQAVEAFPSGSPNYQFQVLYTFTFSEEVRDFTAEDITVTGGTKGTFTGNNGERVYTLLVGTNVLARDANDTRLTVAIGQGAAIGNNSGNSSSPASFIAPVAPVINLVAGDDRVNRQEKLDGFNITGTGTPGAEIILRFDSEPNSRRPGKQTTVQPNGTWSIPITADDVQGFDEGEEGIFVYQNLSGNVSPQRSRFIGVDTLAPTVTITSIGGGDNRVSGVAGDNTVVGTAEPGSGHVTIRFGNTQLGTTAVDGNGNFTYSLTTANLSTIGQGTSKTITASQTDPAGNIGTSTPFTFGVETLAPTDSGQPTVTVTDPNTRKSLSQPSDTVFKFSVEGSTRSSQVLEVVFGDGKTQSILTTLGDLSGLPLGSNSILANLQSALIRFSPNNVDVRSFQLRDMGTGNITNLNIKDVTERGFTLSGGGFTITAQIPQSTDTVKIFTNEVDVNSQSLEAISLSNLIAPPNVDQITVKVDATIYREAAFDNLMGFYLAEKATGAVVNLDPLTGQIVDRVVPNNRQAYLNAVINNAVLTAKVANNEIENISRNFLLNSSINLSDYVMLPFLVANGDLNSVASDFSNLYVASIGTNSDGKDHVQLMGNNIFGFEDIARGGDNDFDDVIFQVRGISIV